MQALCDEFEELCRQLRYHHKACVPRDGMTTSAAVLSVVRPTRPLRHPDPRRDHVLIASVPSPLSVRSFVQVVPAQPLVHVRGPASRIAGGEDGDPRGGRSRGERGGRRPRARDGARDPRGGRRGARGGSPRRGDGTPRRRARGGGARGAGGGARGCASRGRGASTPRRRVQTRRESRRPTETFLLDLLARSSSSRRLAEERALARGGRGVPLRRDPKEPSCATSPEFPASAPPPPSPRSAAAALRPRRAPGRGGRRGAAPHGRLRGGRHVVHQQTIPSTRGDGRCPLGRFAAARARHRRGASTVRGETRFSRARGSTRSGAGRNSPRRNTARTRNTRSAWRCAATWA